MSANDTQIGGKHYEEMGVQPWDAMEAWMSKDQFLWYLKGCAIKYLSGRDKPNTSNDVAKAGHCIAKYLEVDSADKKG